MNNLPISLIFDDNLYIECANKNLLLISGSSLKSKHLKEILTHESFNDLKGYLLNIKKEKSQDVELSFLNHKGEPFYFRGKLRRIHRTKSSRDLYIIHGYEVTSLRILDKLTKLLALTHKILTIAKTEDEVYELLCKGLVEDLGLRFAWIGIPDQQKRVVVPKYKYGYDNGYLKKIKISLDPEVPEGKGPTAQAIRNGEISINPDSRTNPNYTAFREEALKRGYLSSVAIPLSIEGELRSVINIYSSEPFFFTEQIKPLLIHLKETLEFALKTIEKEFLHHILNLSIENSDLWVFILNQEEKIIYVNPIVKFMADYNDDEIFLRKIEDFLVDDELFNQNVLNLLRDGYSHSCVRKYRKKNGEIIFLDLKLIPVISPDGKFHIVCLGRDINMEIALMETVEKLKNFDPLTESLTLRGLSGIINPILNHLRNLALVIVLDIYQFSYINEHFGFARGDEILRSIAKSIQSLLKEGDFIGRVSADEFLLFISDINSKDHIYPQLNSLIDNLSYTFSTISPIPLKFNLGITVYPFDGMTLEDLYQKAKVALDFAKKNGPNEIRFYEKDMDDYIQKTFIKEKLIDEALANNLFIFYFQPKFHTTNLTLAGTEALLRIKKPNGEIISPAFFIHELEKSPRRRDFEIWAVNHLVEKANLFNLSVGVNLYPDTFLDRYFWKEVNPVLGKLKAPLVLEITERGFMKDPDQALGILSELTRSHPLIKLALDDFGTGYSNMTYLKTFQIDYLKIDYSFVKSILDGQKEQGMVKVIIDLAHIISAKAVAEGVETYEQLNILDIMGCDLVQGFYFDKPLPEDEFVKKYLLSS